MLDTLQLLLTLVLALGLLIAVHEFGHYWVARRLGVKVLRFSIGFGKPLWRRVAGADKTEYVIAAFPLGGYVKMLDEREGEVDEAELHRAFNRQSVKTRFAIVAAGPLFNLIFAVFAFWLMYVAGVPGYKPVLAEVAEGTPAYEAGLYGGQRVLAVDGEETPTWESFLEAILPSVLMRETLSVTVDEGGLARERKVDLAALPADAEAPELLKRSGFALYRPKQEPVLDVVEEGAPAALAGLRVGDRIVAVDGDAVDDIRPLAERIATSNGHELLLTIERAGERLELPLRAREMGGRMRIGVRFEIDESRRAEMRSEQRLGLVEALPAALKMTWDMSGETLHLFMRMLSGDISVKHLGGPISIAQYAHNSFKVGLSRFFKTLGQLSVTLAVLNLLPVPLLDGGHLFFYLIEMARGRPVSERTEALGQRIGLLLILSLMSLALFNDLARLVG